MGLEDLVEDKLGGTTVTERIERLHNPELCPSCGTEGVQTEYYAWRCPRPPDECDVLIYIPNDYSRE